MGGDKGVRSEFVGETGRPVHERKKKGKRPTKRTAFALR